MFDLQTVCQIKLCRCVLKAADSNLRIPLSMCLYCCGTGLRNRDREKIIQRNDIRRIPTSNEYKAFDGMHCKKIYENLSEPWGCPSCSRSKYELLRWTILFPKSSYRYEGWAAGFHHHHDHQSDCYLCGTDIDNNIQIRQPIEQMLAGELSSQMSNTLPWADRLRE